MEFDNRYSQWGDRQRYSVKNSNRPMVADLRFTVDFDIKAISFVEHFSGRKIVIPFKDILILSRIIMHK